MHYSSERAASYAETRGVRLEVLTALADEGGLTPESTVVEVGCGSCNHLRALRALAGCSVVGFDPSEGMLDEARKRDATLELKHGRAEEIAQLYPPESFDLVFSVDVIHHLDDIPAYVSGASKVLKPGGRICTATDDESIIRQRRPLSEYWPETVAPELARYPSMERLEDDMKATFADVFRVVVSREYRLKSAEAYERKAFSSLHLISPEAFSRGLSRLRADLARGPIIANSAYILLWGTRRQH